MKLGKGDQFQKRSAKDLELKVGRLFCMYIQIIFVKHFLGDISYREEKLIGDDSFTKQTQADDINCVGLKPRISMIVDEEIEKQADKDLEMLVEIACKLTQDKQTVKEKEAIVDIDQLEISLDVPSEKSHYRRTKPMDISLEDIRKVLEHVKKENGETDIKVNFVTDKILQLFYINSNLTVYHNFDPIRL